MILKNKYVKPFIVFFIGVIGLQGQFSGLEVLNKVEENIFEIQNAYYNFKVESDTESDIFPIFGQYFF